MIYTFRCYDCELDAFKHAKPFTPPSAPRCFNCGKKTSRVFGCNIDTSGCKDPDDIPHAQRIACGAGSQDMTNGQASALEAKHQRHNDQTRKELADGGNRGSFRKSMQIPAALYHGKIKQTGDHKYWDDPKNRNRHKSCKVD